MLKEICLSGGSRDHWLRVSDRVKLSTICFCWPGSTMSSTSKKHKNFVSEPMAEKRVTELAGIGDVLGHRLEESNYDKVDFDFFYLILFSDTFYE